jgi:hypothetical protein
MAETPDEGVVLRNIRKAGWFLVAVGTTFVIIGIGASVSHQLDVAAKTGRATGTVVDYVIYDTGREFVPVGRDPVIEFSTANGERQRYRSGGTWPGEADHVGQEVLLAYDPADPSQATIDDIRDILYPLFICCTVGLSCLLGGTWVLTRFTSWEESRDGVAA